MKIPVLKLNHETDEAFLLRIKHIFKRHKVKMLNTTADSPDDIERDVSLLINPTVNGEEYIYEKN